MAQSLSAFLAQNAVPAEHVHFAASPRFLDEGGRPMEWELAAIDSGADEALRKSCTKNLPVPGGRKGQFMPQLDVQSYLAKLAAASTVFPDLNDAALQDSYKAMGAEQLLKAMLLPGEYAGYLAKTQEANGFDVAMDELVDEVKN